MRWKHIRDEIRIAIKSHRCFTCDERIPPLEKYIRRVGILEGSITAIGYHFHCTRGIVQR